YAAWVVVWTASFAAGAVGAALLSRSASPGMASYSIAFVAIGAMLSAASLAGLAVGALLGAAGAGFGVGAEVLGHMKPDDKAADESPLTMFLPRTIFL
ncbi:MAG: hypothetical protein AB2A00_41210, partial [Myxococcota bacterium]